jgi:mono/diheme cytochrome c family protein
VRGRLVAITGAVAALGAAGCGTEGIQVPEDDPTHRGAMLFSERCSGCHTLEVVGAQGTANRSQRTQGPSFDQRRETYQDVIFAIRNGGFSGAIMPQNIVVGQDAEDVAAFLSKYAGQDVEKMPRPGQSGP